MNEDPTLDITELASAIGTQAAVGFVIRVLRTLQATVTDLQRLSADDGSAALALLADHCHRLKSSTRAVGAMKIARTIADLEAAARAGDRAAARAIADSMPILVDELAASVRGLSTGPATTNPQ